MRSENIEGCRTFHLSSVRLRIGTAFIKTFAPLHGFLSALPSGRLPGSLLSVYLHVFLIACASEPIVEAATERESLSILTTFADAGIPARRVRVDPTQSYQVVVPPEFVQAAASILSKSDLLERRTQRIEQLLERKTFVPPTPDESRMRREYLIALQLERAIEALGGIVQVRVMFPFVAPLDGASANRSFAVSGAPTIAVRYDTGRWAEEILASEVMEILRRAGIGSESSDSSEFSRRVTFVPEPARSEVKARETRLVSLPFPFAFRVPAHDLPRIQVQLYAIMAGAILSSLIVGLYLGLTAAFRRQRWARLGRNRMRPAEERVTPRPRATDAEALEPVEEK